MKQIFLAISLFLFLSTSAYAESAPPSMTTEIEDNSQESQAELSSETGESQEENPAPLSEEEEEATPKEAPEPQPQALPEVKPRRMLTAPTGLKPRRPVAKERSEPQRDSWYIGFGIGSGFGKVKSGEDWKSHQNFLDLDKNTQGIVFESLDVGGTINKNLLIGARLMGAGWGGKKGESELSVSQSALYAAATWFPQSDGKGFFIRGGFGFASLTVNSQTETALGVLSTSDEYGGMGLTSGLGYAFWLGESFNLTLNWDFHYGSFNGDKKEGEPTEGWYQSGTLGFMWY